MEKNEKECTLEIKKFEELSKEETKELNFTFKMLYNYYYLYNY